MEILNSKIEQFFKAALHTPIHACSFDKDGRLEGVRTGDGNEVFPLKLLIAKLMADGTFETLKDKKDRAFAMYLAHSYGYEDFTKDKEFMYSVCGHEITSLDCNIVQGQKGFYKYVNADFTLSNIYNKNTIGFMFRKGFYEKLEQELIYKETMFALSDFNNRVARAFGYLQDNTPLIDANTSPARERVEREIAQFFDNYSEEEISHMLKNFEKQGQCFKEKHQELQEMEAVL